MKKKNSAVRKFRHPLSRFHTPTSYRLPAVTQIWNAPISGPRLLLFFVACFVAFFLAPPLYCTLRGKSIRYDTTLLRWLYFLR